MHHGNINGDDLGVLEGSTLGTKAGSTLTALQVRMQILRSLPTVSEGTPRLFGDGTSASIIALALYGERSPCLPDDTHPAMFQQCA